MGKFPQSNRIYLVLAGVLLLASVTCVVFASVNTVRNHFRRYETTLLPTTEWPGIVYTLASKAEDEGIAVTPERVFRNRGEYFIEYADSSASLKFLIESLNLRSAQFGFVSQHLGKRWLARIPKQLDIVPGNCEFYLSESLSGDEDGDFVSIVRNTDRIVVRYYYDL